jgi:hypothetical protein
LLAVTNSSSAFTMSNVMFNDTDATGIMNLTPQGGTPFDRWFSCCFPKNLENKERSSPNLPESPVHGALIGAAVFTYRCVWCSFSLRMFLLTCLHFCISQIQNTITMNIAKGLTSVAEETQSGILREYSDANVPTIQRGEGSSELDLDDEGQPDFTPQPSFSSESKNVQVSNSVVNEFWKMVISIFFLTWMKKSNQTKKLENGGKSDSPGSVSVDDDSVPVMSFSPEK